MHARQAVLLTSSKSSGPTQLLFYKHNASVSPLFAALTRRPQLSENKSTLSPFFATLTHTAGVSHPLPILALATRHSTLATSPVFSYSYELFGTPKNPNLFV